MADLHEPDYGAAYYRSLDTIKNLKIKVILERVTSASIVPQAQIEKETGGDVEMQEIKMRQNFGGVKDIEEYVFSWQEKVFSEREVEMYRDENNCETVLERQYHQDTKPFRDGQSKPTNRLFSYINHDAFTNKDENVRKMTTDPNEEMTVLAEKMANLRHRRGGANKNNNNSRVPRFNLVDYKPSEELKKQNHYISAAINTMYIMADLRHQNKEPEEESEFVLATIKYDAYGVISIKPDFNESKRRYRVETVGIGRDVYNYEIHHVSHQLSRIEQDKETRMYRELYTRHTEYLSSLVGHDFELPPSDALRLVCYGEIVSAKNFEYDDLYVHYFVEPSEYWHPVAAQHLSGVTQVCRTKTEGRDEVAYFSFPFNFEMIYKNDNIDEEAKKETFPKFPTFYVEVLSLDSWERFRTEGYGYTSLPSQAGVHTLNINCWRPARSITSELRRFFIGGTPELEDPTYTSVPSTFDGKYISRFGFKTISTGSVTVKLNLMQQSQIFLKTASSKKKAGSLLERLGTSQAQADIGNILDAFQRAKKIMMSARENLRTDYIETLRALDDAIDDDED